MRQRQICDAGVVPHEIRLPQARRREERLVGIRDGDVVSSNAHESEYRGLEVLDRTPLKDVTLEPLDDFLVVEPLDDTETPSGLIVPVNEASHVRTGIVASVGPDVTAIEPGDKVLFPREAGYDVRLARSSHRVRVLKREELIARIHD
jgi:co-chaperonin GroES (HSP10)